MIVDTSALIAILNDETGAKTLRARLGSASAARISAGTLIEARLVASRSGDRRDIDELVQAYAIEIVPVDARQAELAHDGFLRFGKGRLPAGLNYGDLFAYALARALGEPLLFAGDDFARTDVKAA